jgi:membrane-associated phospholipid phosphatase
MHFLSDVIAGGIIGSILGFVSFHLYVAMFPSF